MDTYKNHTEQPAESCGFLLVCYFKGVFMVMDDSLNSTTNLSIDNIITLF